MTARPLPPTVPSGAPDRPAPRHVLVAGAGLAATQTLAALRDSGFDGHVTVLGAERLPPYDRPPLSKHLLDRPGPTWLAEEVGSDLLRLADDVRLGTPATALVVTGDGVEAATSDGGVTADAVVLATGAAAVRPAGWSAALTLHTADDAQALRERLRPGVRLVVIGAGWIGAEVAGVAAAAGVDVTVVEAAAGPLGSALGAVGGLTAPWYATAGVRLLCDVQVVEVRADGVTLADGRVLPADVVLAAVGARPATGWLSGALPREPDGSLRVDEGFAVIGAPRHVRAVGDVALRRSARHGWVPGGHWDGALRGPAVLVDDLLHGLTDPPADVAPYVFSTQLGHELALFGQAGPGDDVVLRGDPDAPDGWSAVWFRTGTDDAAAILTVDRPRDVGAARRLFGARDLPRLDRRLVRDPGLPLRETALA